MPIREYSNSELEEIAKSFLATHGQYDGRSLRLEHVIEKFGYRIHQVPGLAEIAEAYVPAMPGYIFVDEEQYQNCFSLRFRFTLAEELAHILIHRPIFEGLNPDQIQEKQESFTDSEYRTIERNAKHLGGCILMPEAKFVERFHHFWGLQRSSVSSDLKLMRYVFRNLSFDFHISCHAAALRALHLQLIDQEQFDEYMESLSNR